MYSEICAPHIMATMLPKGFPADKLSKPQYGVVVERDVMVKVRDGVQIAVDVFRPDGPGRFPSLLTASPYNKDLAYLPSVPTFHMRETNDVDYFVSRGYTYVHMDVRGSGKSVQGQWQFMNLEEQQDFHDVIEWIAERPWCTGKVGMIGESYPGMVQWFAAAQQPEHLACIVPYDANADFYRDIVYHGGMLAVGFVGGWHITEIRGHYRVGRPADDPDVGSWDMGWAIMNHQTFDDFWKVRRADFSKIKCPVFSIGILHKTGLHLRGNIRAYEEIDAPKKLMLCHGDFEGDEMAIFNSPEMRLLLLRWYDHWLKDNDTGMMEEPPVNIFVRGLEAYRRENEWPLARTKYTKLYLHAGPSGAVESLNDGCLSWAAPNEDSSSYTLAYPQADWTGFSGVGTAVMQNGILHPTKKIMTFTSNPLEEDLEVVGSIVLVVYASSDQNEMDFCARLWDQLPDDLQMPGMPPAGRLLTRGWLKSTYRKKDALLSKDYRPYYSHEDPEPVEPGTIYKIEIEVWPTSNRFLKGHRVRIDLANGDSNALDFGGHYYGLKVGNDTIYHDREHPSHIVLPVTPNE
jgi:predicted acyl esterase